MRRPVGSVRRLASLGACASTSTPTPTPVTAPQPPADVVASAAHAGLDVVALTDHDTTAGWEEASAAAVCTGVGLVRGIEISCARDGISVHLLGYLHDPADAGARWRSWSAAAAAA